MALMTNDKNMDLNSFASKQWDRVLAYLQGQFELPRTDCEDIFQEAFIALYQKIIGGQLEDMTASLSTYFMSICRNKALDHMRGLGKMVYLEEQFPQTDEETFLDEQIDKLLALDTDDNCGFELRKRSLVRRIVQDLPSPCNELLWAFYRDGFSMKTLASMFHYKDENAVKVIKHRCCEKFKTRFRDELEKLY